MSYETTDIELVYVHERKWSLGIVDWIAGEPFGTYADMDIVYEGDPGRFSRDVLL